MFKDSLYRFFFPYFFFLYIYVTASVLLELGFRQLVIQPEINAINKTRKYDSSILKKNKFFYADFIKYNEIYIHMYIHIYSYVG